MSEGIAEDSFVSTKSIDDEIKELVNTSGSIRMSTVLCLVAQKLTQSGGFTIDHDTENHTVLKVSNPE